MLIGPTPGGGAGPVLSHHVEYVNLSHSLVSPYRELPNKTSRTFPDQAKGGLWVLGARRWRRRYNPFIFKEFTCLKSL